MAADLWGAENLAGIFPLVSLVSIPGSFAASPLVGFVYQETNYFPDAIGMAAACLFASFIFICLVGPSPVSEINEIDETGVQVGAEPAAPPHPAPPAQPAQPVQDAKETQEANLV